MCHQNKRVNDSNNRISQFHPILSQCHLLFILEYLHSSTCALKIIGYCAYTKERRMPLKEIILCLKKNPKCHFFQDML